MTSSRSALTYSHPEVSLKRAGNGWLSLKRQQEVDTYWMDIIEVVGFSIIGNIDFVTRRV